MTNVTVRGLMKVHKENRRAANEQQRELAHLRHRAYRGCETVASTKRRSRFTVRSAIAVVPTPNEQLNKQKPR